MVQGVAGAGLRGRCGAVQRRLCGKDFGELNDGSGLRIQRVDATPNLLTIERRMLNMKQRTRIFYSDTQKAMMWDRWRRGESIHEYRSAF